MLSKKYIKKIGNALAVQWLGTLELSLQRVWVQSLAGELRSIKLCSVAKKKIKLIKINKMHSNFLECRRMAPPMNRGQTRTGC